MSGKSTVVLICVIYSLIYEFAFRGVAGLIALPVLFPLLVVFYLGYYTLLHGLIHRFQLHNYELFAVVAVVGIPVSVSFSGFRPISEPGVFFIQQFSWAYVLQGLFPFYLAHRLTSHDEGAERITKRGLILSLVGVIGPIVAFAAGTKAWAQPVNPALIMLTIGYWGFWLVVLVLSLARAQRCRQPFVPSRLLDILAGATPVICLILGLIPLPLESMGTSLVRPEALRLFGVWTLLFTLGYAYYRVRAKREMPISGWRARSYGEPVQGEQYVSVVGGDSG